MWVKGLRTEVMEGGFEDRRSCIDTLRGDEFCGLREDSNSFKSLNVNNPITKEVATCSKATTSDTQEEGQSSTPIVENINVLPKQILEIKLVLVDDDGKPMEKVDYPHNSDSDDELMVRCQERHEQILELQSLVGSNVAAESVRFLKEFKYDNLESSRGMMRLAHGLSLDVDDPVDVALAYREKMV
ncbi:hypothetical protein Tco_0226656 [Tanacetum coccineum]